MMENLPASSLSRNCSRALLYAQECKIIICSVGANAHNYYYYDIYIGPANALPAIPISTPLSQQQTYSFLLYTVQVVHLTVILIWRICLKLPN